MPFTTIGPIRLFYRLEGDDSRPTLLLAHSLGADHALWQEQMPELLRFFRVLRFDVRGHGASASPPGDYSMDDLAGDVLNLVDLLGIDRFAFCGLSLGGMIGMRLAALAPERITHLVLANTSARAGDPSLWEDRRRTALERGMGAVESIVLQRSFSPALVEARDPRVASIRRVLLGTDPIGYAGCCAAIRDMDLRETLPSIRVPTLVIAGTRDVATPWEGQGSELAERIPDAQAVRLAAAHLSNIEKPRAFLSALLKFLLPAGDSDPREAGLRQRRAVLGDAHVDRAIASATPFTSDFQSLITRYAWGTVWTRPGLDVRTRRLLVLATTAALGRWEEFRLHIRTGLVHELEPVDIEEVLLQTAIYAGVPAANTAFHIASEEIAASRPDEPGQPGPANG